MTSGSFRIYLWMLGQDVTRGALQERGFVVEAHPEGLGSRVYRCGPVGLHSSGIWLDQSDHWLLYHRERQAFFQVAPGCLPPALLEARKLPFRVGWETLQPFLREHEQWVGDRYGADYRTRLLRIVPPGIRPYRRAWKRYFQVAGGVNGALPPITTSSIHKPAS